MTTAQTEPPAVSSGGDEMLLDYWKECVSEAAIDCGAQLSREQIDCIARTCKGAHENYGMAFYTPPSEHRPDPEVQRLKRELEYEKSLVQCSQCQGTGYESFGPIGRSATCLRCNGKGKVKP